MGGNEQKDQDAKQLQRLGYAQQLLRDMGGFSNFAVSFSIISVLTGALTLYGHGLTFGGPRVMTLGWPLVALMTLTVAASLAELASAFPTAGALYHWSAMLGGKGLGFFTAWLNVIGQFAITAAIDFGLAQFLCDFLGWGRDEPWRVFPVYAAVLLSHGVLNHMGVRAVALLNDLSAWYHLVGVALVVGVLAFLAPRQPVDFLVEPFTAQPYPYVYGFLVGLLQAQWTFTGYDASAHITEETVNPSKNAPWGIFLSVAVSAVAGWALLLAITAAIPDLTATAAAPNPFLHVLQHALPEPLTRALFILVMGAMWFCGLSSVTSNSRMLFAFARDGGTPLAGWVSRVSPRHRTPHVAVWVSTVAAFGVALWSGVYSVMGALSTIALYASYAVPIAAGLWATRTGHWRTRGPWHLGRAGPLINLVALLWVAFITVVFVLPPHSLSGYTFAGCVALLAVYWFGYMRTRFRGPPVSLVALE